VDGLIVLDKPTGITSRDAVNKLQRTLPRKTKIGHTGTLDPLATGVLVVCIGHATRLADYIQAQGKTYTADIVLGFSSDTDDADGTITPLPCVNPVCVEDILAVLPKFTGEIQQTPPSYSAVKVDGVRAHSLARRGREMELTPRPVQIHDITVEQFQWPRLRLKVTCGKGTYIRSLARDIGSALGCGGYIEQLRRTSVGSFTSDMGVSPDATQAELRKRLLPMQIAVADRPTWTTTWDEARRFRCGQRVPVKLSDGAVMVLNEAGELIGLAEVTCGLAVPEMVVDGIS
jgi:tRNA pseudouridine55 synthase